MATGEKVAEQVRSQWQIAASGLSGLLGKMNGIPRAYAATQAQDEWTTWIRLEYGQSSSLALIFPIEVYIAILGKLEGYNYGNVRIQESKKPPQNPTVNGSTIACDIPATSETVKLYAWNFVDFVESAIVGVINGNRLEFANVPAGIYVLADDTLAKFPTTFLTVS